MNVRLNRIKRFLYLARGCSFFWLILLLSSYSLKAEIKLNQQAALNLASYPDIKQGVVDLLYLGIERLWHQGEYDRIFDLFRIITTVKPDDVEAWSLGGWVLINTVAPKYTGEEKNGIVEYGVDFIRQGIAKNPESARLYYEVAWFFYNRGGMDKALEYLEKAEEFGYDFKTGHLKAHIYMKKGIKDAAIREWEKIRERFPENKRIAERFIKELEQKSN